MSTMTEVWEQLCRRLAEQTGQSLRLCSARAVHGGCIDRAYRLDTDAGAFFVKTSEGASLPRFEAEVDGLNALAASGHIRLPQPLLTCVMGETSFLVLEYLELTAPGKDSYSELGHALAALHALPREHFGWHLDNYIGATPQDNTPASDWAGFYRTRRLQPLFRSLAAKGVRFEGEDRLLQRLEDFFDRGAVSPSLLHGDLWSGNAAFLADGTPLIFDPAVYCGHDEADLAMTELFGGFPAAFYHAYHEVRPLQPGYREARCGLYQLYHVLNHALLFGGGYSEQAQAIIHRIA